MERIVTTRKLFAKNTKVKSTNNVENPKRITILNKKSYSSVETPDGSFV